MSVRGNFTSLARFSASLRNLSTVVGQKVAAAAAPALTAAARATFDASENAFGIPWKPGEDGGKVTLRKSGSLAGTIRYVAVGTRIRVALGVRYAKYQIWRRPVFPRQSDPLPMAYVRTLERAAADVIRAELAP